MPVLSNSSFPLPLKWDCCCLLLLVCETTAGRFFYLFLCSGQLWQKIRSWNLNIFFIVICNKKSARRHFSALEFNTFGYCTRSKSDPQWSFGFVLGFLLEWMGSSGAQAEAWGLRSHSNHLWGAFGWHVAPTQTLLVFSQRQEGQGSLAGRENWLETSLAHVCPFDPFRTSEMTMRGSTTELNRHCSQWNHSLPRCLGYLLLKEKL